MKCQDCGKEATIRLTKVVNNKKEELSLCKECARKQGPTIEHIFNHPSDNISKITLSSKKKKKVVQEVVEEALADVFAGPLFAKTRGEPGGKTCPKCGTTLMEIVKGGKFGCPHDYEFFQEELMPMIKKVHSGCTQHKGKFPEGSVEVKKQITILEEEMSTAVKGEKYERAAQLRDRIKTLRTQVKK